MALANILETLPQLDPSILQAILQGGGMPASAMQSGVAPAPQTNIMQQIAGEPSYAPTPAPVPQAPQPATPAEPPRARRSLLDTVGRISDVFAKVGGAEALYQPTLDASADRARQIDLGKLQRTLTEQQIASGQGEITDANTSRIGQAARGFKALLTANPNADPAAIWPLLAKQAGIPDDQAQTIWSSVSENPALIDGLIALATDPKLAQSKYGGSVVYGKNAAGELVAFQPGLGEEGGRNILPEGITPIDPLKFVDTGGGQVGVGSRSGEVQRILPKSMDPNTRGNIASRERVARWGNQSRENVADTRANKAGDAQTGGVEAAMGNLAEIRQIYTDLDKMGAMVSPKKSTGSNLLARGRASGVGQILEGAVGTEAQTLRDRVASIRPALMQSIAKATGMTGKQLDSNADVKLFMQTVTDPTASYEANKAAIAGLERFLKSNAKAAPAAAPRQRVQPRGTGKSSNGWSIVGVK